MRKKLIVLGLVSTLLVGCGSTKPEEKMDVVNHLK